MKEILDCETHKMKPGDKTPDGETPRDEIVINYKAAEKIDTKKDLKKIIEENIKNFKNPSNDVEFIENQLLLDYITCEKFKKTEANLKDTRRFKNPVIKDLLKYYEKKKCKVYIDNTIDVNLYSQFQKYYFNENAFKKKIRIHLNIDKNKLNDQNKIKNIVDKIINKISAITKIPKKDLYVANIRKNCFICEIVHIVRQVIDGFNNLIDLIHKFSAGEIRENLINAHRNDLREFLQQIEREHGNNDDISDEDKFEIRYIMDNLLIRPDYYFNGKYDKIRGDFGLRHFLFIPYHKESIIKNGKTYYYPNQR
jgi:hypothetical protein